MCATFQKDLFASLVSGTDMTDTQWALSLSPSRGLVFSDKEGAQKPSANKEGHSSSARTPGTCAGSEQPRGATGLSPVCVALGLSGFSCTGTLVPSKASPHQVGQSHGHSFNFLPKNPKKRESPEPFSCPSHTSTAQGDAPGEASPAGGGWRVETGQCNPRHFPTLCNYTNVELLFSLTPISVVLMNWVG